MLSNRHIVLFCAWMFFTWTPHVVFDGNVQKKKKKSFMSSTWVKLGFSCYTSLRLSEKFLILAARQQCRWENILLDPLHFWSHTGLVPSEMDCAKHALIIPCYIFSRGEVRGKLIDLENNDKRRLTTETWCDWHVIMLARISACDWTVWWKIYFMWGKNKLQNLISFWHFFISYYLFIWKIALGHQYKRKKRHSYCSFKRKDGFILHYFCF